MTIAVRDGKRVAVIGAGWAGCAAAVELVRRGHQVQVLEASRMLGGRARAQDRHGWAFSLDNGQHILLGAYRDTLGMMRAVGVDANAGLLRLPLQMCYPGGCDGMAFIAGGLPAPLHLLAALFRARGLTRADKMALARFTTSARWIDWRLNQDCTVGELLDRFDQTGRVIDLLWRPLCLAALNTPPERASGQVFLNVLRDSMGARRAASDMLLPRVDLSALFPMPAARFIQSHGSSIRLGSRVGALRQDKARWQLEFVGENAGDIDGGAGSSADVSSFDAVIVATPAAEANRLLAGVGVAAAESLAYESITTCYLQYAPTMRLQRPLYALRDDATVGHWGQFVFDRGQLDAAQAGLLAVVVSAADGAIALGSTALTGLITAQLAAVFSNPALAAPVRVQLISEKRATFSCAPGLSRPGVTTSVPGLLRAGDYVAGPYPATLEGAVRSGIAAARLLDTR